MPFGALSCQLLQLKVSEYIWPRENPGDSEVEWFYEDLQDLLELIPPKDVLFIIEDWNAKVGSQETPGSEEELKSFLIKVKEENEKAGLKLHIQKTKIMHLVPLFCGK